MRKNAAPFRMIKTFGPALKINLAFDVGTLCNISHAKSFAVDIIKTTTIHHKLFTFKSV